MPSLLPLTSVPHAQVLQRRRSVPRRRARRGRSPAPPPGVPVRRRTPAQRTAWMAPRGGRADRTPRRAPRLQEQLARRRAQARARGQARADAVAAGERPVVAASTTGRNAADERLRRSPNVPSSAAPARERSRRASRVAPRARRAFRSVHRNLPVQAGGESPARAARALRPHPCRRRPRAARGAPRQRELARRLVPGNACACTSSRRGRRRSRQVARLARERARAAAATPPAPPPTAAATPNRERRQLVQPSRVGSSASHASDRVGRSNAAARAREAARARAQAAAAQRRRGGGGARGENEGASRSRRAASDAGECGAGGARGLSDRSPRGASAGGPRAPR